MSTVLRERPAPASARDGGLPARRAVTRWAWRMFRREWRQQVLLLTLLSFAVAATCAGLGLVGSVATGQESDFGTANYRITLDAHRPDLSGDLATLRAAFGTIEVIERRGVSAPGSANPVDVRAEAPHGTYSHPMLRLTGGRYPAGPGEAAVTARAARLFKLRLGGTWTEGGRTWSVVGLVENPSDLLDTFILVAPSQAGPLEDVTVLVKASREQFAAADLPNNASVDVRSSDESSGATVAVLVLATIGLLFIGLLAAAGFTVLAQRRLRALGMLGAVGASHRHVRLVLVANGAAVGTVAALLGTTIGLGSWFLLAPRLEGVVQRRLDRFDLPWWGILVAAALAVLTAVVASWWPARTIARIPIVAALAARPAPPRPAHRFAIPGVVLLAAGLSLLVAATPQKPAFIVAGVVAVVLGMLLLAPLGITLLAALARVSPVAVRLALRDLARYQARAGAALAAVSLAAGIAAAIVVAAAAAEAAAVVPPTGGNLAADQALVWIAPERIEAPIPQLPADRLHSAETAVNAVAATVRAPSALPLLVAVDPDAPTAGRPGGGVGKVPLALGIPSKGEGDRILYRGDEMIPLYVATPAVLQHYGIAATAVDPTADVLTSRASLAGYDLLGRSGRPAPWQPKVQQVALPAYTSGPSVLITPKAMRTFGAQAMPVAWLLQAPRPLTPQQIDQAQTIAGGAGLTVETRPAKPDLSSLRTRAMLAGIAAALGVLAMTVGLIRSESARDLRTLTAAGAPPSTRRTLTATTTAALAVLGALFGTAGAYAAMLAWYHKDLDRLTPVPITYLVGILIGLPVVAGVAGWLLAGREPAGIDRSPLD